MTTATAPGSGALVLRRPRRRWLAAAVLVTWVLLWLALRGRDTLPLAPSELTGLHRWLNDVADAVGRSRTTSPVFTYVLEPLRVGLDAAVGALQALIAQPAGGRPVPRIGWLGVVALAGWLAWATGGVRSGLVTVGGLVLIGLQGLWVEGMDTLAITLCAVALCVAVGVPLGVWAGLSDRVSRLVLPVLDFLQAMPTLVYLVPLTLFLLIGPASATVATALYALPPVVRLTALGVREVPRDVVEAATSSGATRAQALRTVLLPLARRSVVLGVNQTMMAALAMVTVAALIDAPGLGKTVIRALTTLDVGAAFNAGLAIVVLAVVLDRATSAAAARRGTAGGRTAARRGTAAGRTAASRGTAAASRDTTSGRAAVLRATAGRVTGRVTSRDSTGHSGGGSRGNALALVVGAGVALAAVQLSRTYLWAAQFPTAVTVGGSSVDIGIGGLVERAADAGTAWVQDHLSGLTTGTKDAVTLYVLDPLEELLTGSPWWVVVGALVALAALAGGRAAATSTAVGLALLLGTGLWADAMTTLASTVLATAVVMVLGVAVGVWTGRSRAADRVVRPLLDAAQTLPAFVYLVPFLALFSASRFTAIVAAVVYAAPAVVRIVADGVRGVPTATVEAATALGATRWQTVAGVQLPMARGALAVAANQGVVLVLSMVVVGGLVGAGALGYDVVAGFSQSGLYGKGLAAGLAIVLLGTVLDRVTQAAARRAGPSRP